MTVVVALHLAAATLLAVWGVHRLWHLAAWVGRPRRAPAPPVDDDALPTITVQLPLYNEAPVAARAVDALCALAYPREKLEVQVLDDSTDGTVRLVEARVRAWQARGVDVTHVRRPHRDGYKAGALAHGLAHARGSLVAVFDADFVPEPSFLRALVGEIVHRGADMVQARWDHENRDASPLTRAQAACLDAHFTVEHAARAAKERFFNFNGTAGIWQKDVIARAGGWDSATLTEDLDLSLRAFLVGARFSYRDDVSARAELPVEATAFLGQQHRWAKGSMQTARRRLPAVWRAPLGLVEKVDLTLRLAQNAAFLWLALLVVTLPLVAVSRAHAAASAWLVADGGALLLATAPVVAHLVVAGRVRGRGRAALALDVVLAFGLGAALAIPNAIAVVAGALDVGDQTFHRTPKRGDTVAVVERRRVPRGAWLTLGQGVVMLSTAAWLIERGAWASVPVLVAFGLALAGLGGMALVEVTRGRWAAAREAPGDAPAYAHPGRGR